MDDSPNNKLMVLVKLPGFKKDSTSILSASGTCAAINVGIKTRIAKMRRTNHKKGFFSISFTPHGLKIGEEGSSVLMK